MSATYNVWHGTNQRYSRFDVSSRGMNTSNSASEKAFFFAARPDTAWTYAEYAARNLIPQQQQHERFIAGLLARAEVANRHGRLDLYEKFINEAEAAERKALQAVPSGARLLLCKLEDVTLMEVDGCDNHVRQDLASVLDEAGASGFDGVLIRDIHDIPSGDCARDDHFALFESAKINIKRSFDTLAAAEDIHSLLRDSRDIPADQPSFA